MLEQLLTAMAPIFKEDHAIPSLMKSMPLNYWTFIIAMKRQLNITLQPFITNLLQEDILMKSLNVTSKFIINIIHGKKTL
jgi:hypothetical protein